MYVCCIGGLSRGDFAREVYAVRVYIFMSAAFLLFTLYVRLFFSFILEVLIVCKLQTEFILNFKVRKITFYFSLLGKRKCRIY